MQSKTLEMRTPSLLWQLATVALVFLYGFGSFPGDSLHAIVHATEVEELHSIVHENDACHQTIFHADTEKGCEHKTHLLNGSKCAFTQIGHEPSHFAEYPHQMHAFAIALSHSRPIEFDFVSAFAGFFASRAPPVG